MTETLRSSQFSYPHEYKFWSRNISEIFVAVNVYGSYSSYWLKHMTVLVTLWDLWRWASPFIHNDIYPHLFYLQYSRMTLGKLHSSWQVWLTKGVLIFTKSNRGTFLENAVSCLHLSTCPDYWISLSLIRPPSTTRKKSDGWREGEGREKIRGRRGW